MTTMLPMWLALLAGCAETSRVFSETLPAGGVSAVFCDIERGTFAYVGGPQDEFDIEVVSWGEGSSLRRAEARADSNEWGAQVTGNLLDVWGRSPTPDAGTDVTIGGPERVDVEAVLLDGAAYLGDVDGYHVITANSVQGDRLRGSVDLYASLDGVDVDVYPSDGDVVRIEAFGDVILQLPWGLEYDLEVFVDPAWGAEVFDLGFDDLYLAPDYVSAVSGSGSIEVDVFLAGGTFFLWEAPPLPE